MPRITAVKATIENMRRYEHQGAFAYSPWTGEEFSADPGDYWDAPAGWTMRDSEGEVMELVMRMSVLHPPFATPMDFPQFFGLNSFDA